MMIFGAIIAIGLIYYCMFALGVSAKKADEQMDIVFEEYKHKKGYE